MLLGYHGSTNYSIVDLELIEELYRRSYQEKVHGFERLKILTMSRRDGLTGDQHGVRAVIENPGHRRAHRPRRRCDRLRRRPDGSADVGRDYRIVTGDDVDCGIYVQGPTETSHGLGSTLLFNTAVRAGEITQSLLSLPRPLDHISRSAGP